MSSPYNGKDAKNIILCYFKEYASVVEWSITTDCKSVAFGLRRFESYPAHKFLSLIFQGLFLLAGSRLELV